MRSLSPRRLRLFLNCYPPFFAAGIRVEAIAPDFRRIDVALRLRRFNRNAVGTHYGGSLYSMTDPFYMLMLMRLLGPDYIVWDKRACVDFVRPGRGTVRARFEIDDARLDAVRAVADRGDKALPTWPVDVVDEAGAVVARVDKTLYVRRKARRA